MTVHDFAFADHAEHFDQHITDSIPGYPQLRQMAASLSPPVHSGGHHRDRSRMHDRVHAAIRKEREPARPPRRKVPRHRRGAHVQRPLALEPGQRCAVRAR